MPENLSNNLLVATPGTQDAVFAESVIYIYQQDPEGIVGFMVNKVLQIQAENILPHLSVKLDKEKMKDLPILLGGPVSPEQGLIIYEKNMCRSETNIAISTQEDPGFIPEEANNFLVILGHSFWEPRELDEQIAKNEWLIVPFQRDIVFSKEIGSKWKTALASIGINLSSFSEAGGHG